MKASNWGKLSIEEGWDRSMYGLMNSAMQRRLLDGKKLLPPEADYCLHPGEHDYYKRYGQPTSLDVGERCRHWGLSDAETAAIVARAENADERGL